MWGLFDGSSSEDDGGEVSESETAGKHSYDHSADGAVSAAAVSGILQRVLAVCRSDRLSAHPDTALPATVTVMVCAECPPLTAAVLTAVAARMPRAHVCSEAAALQPAAADVVVAAAASPALHAALVPGGSLLLVGPAAGAVDAAAAALDDALWVTPDLQVAEVPHGWAVAQVCRRRCLCNTQVVAWADPSAEALARERALLEAVTVRRSVAERRSGHLSSRSLSDAVHAVQEHGFVVLPGLFELGVVQCWASAMLDDLAAAKAALAARGVDLVRAGTPDHPIGNFHELGMRTPLRCDLRHGPAMTRLCAARGDEVRKQPGVCELVQAVAYPPPTDTPHAAGDWGRWNFDLGGPDAPHEPLVTTPPAAVISFPGAKDQALHADTPHLYQHTHLPPHYLNFFLPGGGADSARGMDVGQTGFLVGTHRLAASHAAMAHPDGEAAGLAVRQQRLVRPHLQLGDALLFDVRTLHFGMANNHRPADGADATAGVRPAIYVNFHQRWWNRERVDKNFEPVRLFPVSTDTAAAAGAGGAAAAAGAGSAAAAAAAT